MLDEYKGKKVLITGHTGFKGSWLAIWLKHLGAEVIGIAVDIPTTPSMFEVCRMSRFICDFREDVRNLDAIKKIIREQKPDFIFHLAAQAIVKQSYHNPKYTMEVNAFGSINILEALRGTEADVVAIMITSDKAYDNLEWVWGYRETDRLGGKDPYSASKGMAELAIHSYVQSFFNGPESNVRIGITRAGNVIGGGDWAENRIVPDCMRAWADKKTVDIRNPKATRPWQHVLEPLSGYLTLGAMLSKTSGKNGEAYNFGPSADQNFTVKALIEKMSDFWENVKWRDEFDQNSSLKEAGLLKLNCDKALSDLNWQPTLEFEETIKMTTNWYKKYYHSPEKSMFDFTLRQIESYALFGASRGLIWAN